MKRSTVSILETSVSRVLEDYEKILKLANAYLFWFSPFKKFQRLFFHTPLVYLFVFGSSMYHDYFWYPIIGKMHIDNFEKKSPWGELFLKWK